MVCRLMTIFHSSGPSSDILEIAQTPFFPKHHDEDQERLIKTLDLIETNEGASKGVEGEADMLAFLLARGQAA